jgi:hypothetical protein
MPVFRKKMRLNMNFSQASSFIKLAFFCFT